MAYSRDQQNAELDRMVARLVAEQSAIMTDHAGDYAHSRNITGEPSEKNRVYRASDDCWNRGMKGRTSGVANPAIPIKNTVRVIHADGSTEIRSTESFRAENLHKKQRRHATTRTVHDAGSDYWARVQQQGTIGNVE